jgi:parvulin-like peptidyl-prolyl isomerase
MSNSTAQKSKQRPSQHRTPQRTTARRQTAHLEGRRDGKPLIFGWGKHLTRAEKTRIQTIAAYSFGGLVLASLLGVFAFAVIQQNVLLPNSAIVKVNSASVSQDTYRKTLAYNAQDQWNTLQKNLALYNDQGQKIQNGDKSQDLANAQNALISQLQSQTTQYKQAAITQDTMDLLVNDQLIQQSSPRIKAQHPDAAKALTPTQSEIDKRLDEFKKAFPKGESYANFLSKNTLSDDDVKATITLRLRQEMMQTYLASQLTSPTTQIHARHIETNDKASAQQALDKIRKDNLTATTANWSDLAKTASVDPNSKDAGGDMGWIAEGANDAGLEVWLFDPARKVGDLSAAPIATAGGTWDIVQILGIDPSKPIEASQLQGLKDNALGHWLSGQRVAPFNKISTPDADAMQSAHNIPQTPNLNATLPDFQPTVNPPGNP